MLFYVCIVLLLPLVVAKDCPLGWGYPAACPGPSDPPDRTRCCRNFTEPACCQERASVICAQEKFRGRRDQDETFQRPADQGKHLIYWAQYRCALLKCN